MIDLDYISKLLPLLKSEGVHTFKNAGLEISFHVELKSHVDEGPSDPRLAKDTLIDVPIDEQSLPVDIRTDNITDYDKILNWSGSPDQDQGLPLTGEDHL